MVTCLDPQTAGKSEGKQNAHCRATASGRKSFPFLWSVVCLGRFAAVRHELANGW
jgi:hypothetical protein